jgi:hypothetical protein
VHALAEVHDTLVSVLPRVPGGVVIGWMDQEVPFHVSASAAPSDPAAIHALAEAQDTPFSAALLVVRGAGTFCTDHLVPFHRSAAGMPVEPVKYRPAAVHSVAEVQDTP